MNELTIDEIDTLKQNPEIEKWANGIEQFTNKMEPFVKHYYEMTKKDLSWDFFWIYELFQYAFENYNSEEFTHTVADSSASDEEVQTFLESLYYFMKKSHENVGITFPPHDDIDNTKNCVIVLAHNLDRNIPTTQNITFIIDNSQQQNKQNN